MTPCQCGEIRCRVCSPERREDDDNACPECLAPGFQRMSGSACFECGYVECLWFGGESE